MPYYTRPDVYVEELSTKEGPIRGARTGFGGMQAVTEKGPVGKPVRVRSFEAWKKVFGGYESRGDAAYEAESFFNEGGFELITVRQAHYTDLEDATSFEGVVANRMHITEGVAATPALKTSNVGPFDILGGGDWGFMFTVDGGGSFLASVAAESGYIQLTSGVGTDQDGLTLLLSIDGGPTQTVTFSGAAITAQEIINQINEQVMGVSCLDGGTDEPRIKSDKYGTGSSVHIVVGGTSTLVWDTTYQDGQGTVVDATAVTATEMKAILDTIVGFTAVATATVNADGSFTIQTVSTGAGSSLNFTDGNTVMGIAVETVTGTDAGATYDTLQIKAGYKGYESPGVAGNVLRSKIVQNPFRVSAGAGSDVVADITPADTEIQVSGLSGLAINSVITITDGTHTEHKIVSAIRTDVSGSTVSYFVEVSTGFAYGYSAAITTMQSNEFDLYVYEGTKEVELWAGLSMLDAADNYVETRINDEATGSEYVVALDNDAACGIGADTPATDSAAVFLAGGTDETLGMVPLDWVGTQTGGTGLYAWDTIREFMPFCTVGTNSAIVIHQAALYAKSRLYFEYLTYVDHDDSGADAVAFRMSTVGVSSSYATMYAGGIKVFDPVGSGSNPQRRLHGMGAAMGVRARVDALPGNAGGPWETPAGEGDYGTVNYALDVSTDYKDTETGPMNEAGINVLRKFGNTNPVVFYGGRTLDMSADKAFLYINVRRFFQFVEKSIAESTRWAVFRNNNFKLWSKLEDRVDEFLSDLMPRGAFPTNVKELAFFVNVGTDSGVMTQADIDAGRVKGRVGLAANKPGEFIIWEFAQYDSGWSIVE